MTSFRPALAAVAVACSLLLATEPAVATADRVRSTLSLTEVVEVLRELPRSTQQTDALERVSIDAIDRTVKETIPEALRLCPAQGLPMDLFNTSFFLSRRSLLADAKWGMPLWQDHLFIFLSRNATNATEFFRIPTSRVVELGSQVEI